MTEWTGKSLTADDMWTLMNKKENNNFGIAGYESPKIYFDHKRKKTDRENWEMHSKVWDQKDHYPKLKLPVDKDGKEILPKRPSFIEEIIKSKKANFSQEKFDKFVEKLKEKGTSIEEFEGIKPKKSEEPKEVKRSYKDRTTIIAEIFKEENKKHEFPPNLQEVVDKVKEKHAKYPPKEKLKKSNLRYV